jgi:hypothetical protein
MDAVRQCHVCGCHDLAACQTEDGPCHWVEHDLCSACAPKGDQGLALAAAMGASSAVAELIRFTREGDGYPDRFSGVDVLEQLLDAAKMVMEIEDDFADERGQVYGAIRNLLEGWVP